MTDLPVGEPVVGWVAPAVPEKKPLSGDHVTVTPFSADSVEDLWAAFALDDGRMWTYMGYGPFRTRAELASHVELWPYSEDPIFYTFDVDGVSLGWGSYLRIDPGFGTIEVGHLAFSPQLQRTTAATEAMYLMAKQAFDMGYRRYEWKADALNAASRRAAERLGFTLEGVFRNHVIYKGRNRDTAWFSIIDREWPSLSARLEAWLDPTNFDDEGNQVTALAQQPPL